MRRRIAVMVAMVMMVIMSAAPAFAVSDKPKRAQPVEPPGYENGQQSEEAAFPQTGGINKITHGSPQNGKG
jgi:hypothetical protein